MIIHNAQFEKSSSKLAQCPDPDRHEYAFIGRSNVGKSSLINYLVGRKQLAKTSGRPGKTTLINHFLINQEEDNAKSGWYLVDLPGYGYAATARTDRRRWLDTSKNYLRQRDSLMYLFVLIDSRHEAQKVDLDFLNWLGAEGMPFGIVFTKIDKLSKGAVARNLDQYKKKLLETWENLPNIFVTSSEKKVGGEEILDLIEETNKVDFL